MYTVYILIVESMFNLPLNIPVMLKLQIGFIKLH